MQVVGIVIAIAYYMLRKQEIKQQEAIMLDDSNAQTMVSLTRQSDTAVFIA